MEIKGIKGKKTRGPKEKRVAKKDGEGVFTNLLVSKDEELRIKEIQNMLQSIEAQGEKLKKTRSLADLKLYKKGIKKFLQIIADDTRRAKQTSRIGPDGTFRIYTIIEKVDGVLKELTEALLAGQKDIMKIAGKIEEIRGLLLDVLA